MALMCGFHFNFSAEDPQSGSVYPTSGCFVILFIPHQDVFFPPLFSFGSPAVWIGLQPQKSGTTLVEHQELISSFSEGFYTLLLYAPGLGYKEGTELI